MKKLKTVVNRMPVPTWNRLGINSVELTLNGPEVPIFVPDARFRVPDGVRLSENFGSADLDGFGKDYFVPAEVDAFIREHANRRYLIQIPKDYAVPEPVIAELSLSSQAPGLMDDIVIEAQEGSKATVIIKYGSESGAGAEHCGRTRLIVRPGASLRLVKVQLMDTGALHTDAVEGVVHKNARADVILAEMGALKSVSSCNLQLAGASSAAALDVIYLGDGERELDMSCRMEHLGKKTVSQTRVKGILLGQSRKVLRDTIDFISGSSGARGREEESVLLLSPDVRNISVPLLLCGEDDVEGEHAASSGRPDEKVLFYLMSRGINELEAQKLLAQAAISVIVENIPDESLQEEILEAVSNSVTQGGQKL